MGSLADFQRELDEEIFDDIGEILVVGSVETGGIFYNQPADAEYAEGTFVGREIFFDCQINATIAGLVRNDEVQVIGRDDDGNERDLGTYRFSRRNPDAGDESGRVRVELLTS